MNYTLDYFIKKFTKIPENKWITGMCERGDKHCVLGHCGAKSLTKLPEEALALIELIPCCPEDKRNSYCGDYQGVVIINDGLGDPDKKNTTPKQRILKKLKSLLVNKLTGGGGLENI